MNQQSTSIYRERERERDQFLPSRRSCKLHWKNLLLGSTLCFLLHFHLQDKPSHKPNLLSLCVCVCVCVCGKKRVTKTVGSVLDSSSLSLSLSLFLKPSRSTTTELITSPARYQDFLLDFSMMGGDLNASNQKVGIGPLKAEFRLVITNFFFKCEVNATCQNRSVGTKKILMNPYCTSLSTMP